MASDLANPTPPSPTRAARQPSVAELQAALASGATTAERLIEARLGLAQQAASGLNAFLAVTEETALAQARTADQRREAGAPPRRLEGVPVACKDMFTVAGRRPTFGAPPADIDLGATPSPVVERMTAEGAVGLGFLNMAPFALGATGHNPTFGDCRNPWDPTRIAGGSSSGAGAAVAAGVVSIALGSDTGGSIRIPAACCGVVGFRPVSGAVDRTGALPLAGSFDALGPIASCVADARLAYAVFGATGAAKPCADRPPARVLYPARAIAEVCDPQVSCALDAAVEILSRDGAQTDACDLPDLARLHALAERVQAFEAFAFHGQRLRAHPEAYPPHVRRRIEPGLGIAAADYLAARDQRAPHRARFLAEVLRPGAVLVVPTLGAPTPTLAETDPERAGDAVSALTRWTRWISYLDLPAITLPCGFDRNGMPIGLQIAGAPGEEALIFAVAERYERLTDWPNQAGWPCP